ncbi:restriction endonuclease subunit S [Enterobacter bugandensis]|uniref:restriction endonuclease subunit S n=5 Tax=Enterobacter TaxID=547 RepID=UPI001F240806|nr:restriction endonuclease subunit S [Enterobacter bugandensis]MCK7375590.1 restriction endonuclease subunit S [Enterobacter bugandensis]MCM7428235.1 restriction endonuclease subunit S [Enterobacter bugandensis]
MTVEKLITDHIDIWSSALQTRSTAGRGSNGKIDLYGIKKLRELILELAVRGKLVPQDPNDEPASELLKRIAAEKAELVKQGKIKKQKPLPEISEDEKPFELPEGWELNRLGDLINVINGRAYKKHEMLQAGTPLLRVGNLFTSNEWYYSDLELEPEKYIDNGDLIYSWSASFGPFIWNGGKVIYHYHIWKMDIFDTQSLDKHFMKLYLESVSASIKASGNGIAMIHMTKERMEKLVIPLPPRAEQLRIVAKVNELMSLCDQLEQQSLTSLDAHQQLVETLLSTLTDCQNAEELAENWARISQNFDTLFTTEASIDALKQTILQLAVMGKLVPQDPNDEPASELLKRIEQEKAQLVKEGKIKKQKPLPPISDDEKPFELPQGWVWCQFDHIAKNEANALKAGPFGSALKKSMYVPTGYKIYGQEQVISGDENLGDYYVDREKYESLISCKVQPGDMLISLVGTIGKVLVLSNKCQDGIINPRLVKISLFKDVCRNYIQAVLASKLIQDELFQESHGSTMHVLNLGLLKKLIFPLPPMSEQFRIIDKINALDLLCEHLKSRLQSAQQTQLHLADTLTDAALN